MKCDNCGQPVRIADGLHSSGYRHDNDEPNGAAEWCETAEGFVRVSVNGCREERNEHQRVGS